MSALTETDYLSLIIKRMKLHTAWPTTAACRQTISTVLFRTKRESVLGTENGLSFYNQKEQTFTNWTREQGLQGANFNPTAGIHTRNGQLILEVTKVSSFCPTAWNCPQAFPATWYSLT